MATSVETATGVLLTLADAPFAAGGEADLYRVMAPANRRGQVIKRYKPDKRTPDRARKIEFLTRHPPDGPPPSDDGHRPLVWPLETVHEQGRFVGFVMPDAPGEKLELLCLPALPAPLRTAWNRFDRSRAEGQALRLKLCFNLAVALFRVHESGRYVLVDMKPDNIIVRPDGLMSIIDLDSVQVLEQDRLLFAAPVTTPEYSPPEPVPTPPDTIDPAWDRFSLAVIFYRLLCGIHPFTGTAKPPQDHHTDTAGMIRHGLFPNGSRAARFAVVPGPHRTFGQLPPAVQRLFRQCFDDGHDQPQTRPSADDWCRALSGQSVGYGAGASRRQLPSARLSAPTLTVSVALPWGVSSLPDVPTVVFADLDRVGGFWMGVRRLLASPARSDLRRSALRVQAEVRQALLALTGYAPQFAQIAQMRQARQTALLMQEQADLATLGADWLRVLAELDTEAEADGLAELKAIRQARQLTQNERQSLEKQRQTIQTRLVGKLETELTNQQNAIRQRIDALADEETLARQRALGHPQKLAGYRIETDKQLIFGANLTVLAQKLAAAGLHTAADFIAVRDGQFQRRGRGWVKVPGVGKQRANELMVWRQQVETRHDTLLQTMLDTRFDPLRQQLLAERQTLLTHYEPLLTQARAQAARKTAPLTAQLADLNRRVDEQVNPPFEQREADRLRRAEQERQRIDDRADLRRTQTVRALHALHAEETARYETLRRSYLTDRAHLLAAIDQMRRVEAVYLG